MRSRVLINLTEDKTTALRGVLFEQRGDWLVLKTAEALTTDGKATAIDGDVVIECARISFVQVLS
jgi:hypothetical protein